MKQVIAIIGVVWAILGWLLWVGMPHRSRDTALISAMLLAPAYLVLAARKGRLVALRWFVATAVLWLVGVGFRLIPGGDEMLGVYLWLPPLVGVGAWAVSWLAGRTRGGPGGEAT